MKETIKQVFNDIRKSNSSYGNYAIPCIIEYQYNNGKTRVMETFIYTWTEKKAKEIVNIYAGNV